MSFKFQEIVIANAGVSIIEDCSGIIASLIPDYRDENRINIQTYKPGTDVIRYYLVCINT
jgi:hypothetical protein